MKLEACIKSVRLLITLLWGVNLVTQGAIASTTDIQDRVVRDAIRYVRTDRLSERVLLAYWVGTGHSNLIALQSQKGLVMIDTEMSPRIMQPIKRRIEHELGRDDWLYVINTHGHMHHAGGNHLFPNATVVGHENLTQDVQWMIEDQTDPERYRKQMKHASNTLINLRNAFPYFYEPSRGQWEYGTHERNIRNLWHILNREQ